MDLRWSFGLGNAIWPVAVAAGQSEWGLAMMLRSTFMLVREESSLPIDDAYSHEHAHYTVSVKPGTYSPVVLQLSTTTDPFEAHLRAIAPP